MTFLAPARLWLLLVVLALAILYAVLQARRSRYAVRFTNLALLDRVAPTRMRWRQHVAVVLALATLGGAIVLFAQPSDLGRVPRRTSVTVVLTIDVSLSMSATDVPPDRITAAKVTAKRFIAGLPGDYQVALVSFSHYAHVVVAPTTDRTVVARAIDSLRLSEYTATGEGIFTALGVVRQALGGGASALGQVPAMIVMISDGTRTVGRSQVLAAKAAKRQGVPIFTVALGNAGATISNKGQTIAVPVQVAELRQVSRISGGRSYTASTLAELTHAYRDVSGRVFYELEPTDVTSRYIGWLALVALLSAVAGLSVASRWP